MKCKLPADIVGLNNSKPEDDDSTIKIKTSFHSETQEKGLKRSFCTSGALLTQLLKYFVL